MKTVGHQIPNLLAAMKSNRGPANQACEKWGRVEVTYESRGAQQSQLKKDSAVVCFQLNAPSTNQAVTSFRKLYESAELFVSAP